MEPTMAMLRDRERLSAGLALAVLTVLTVLAWAYLSGHAAHAHHSPGAPAPRGWDTQWLAMSTLMWSVMMVAMMLPVASPMILTFNRVYRRRILTDSAAAAPTSLFVGGYLAVWTGFSVIAASGQWALHENGMLDSAMGRAAPLLGASLLVLAGGFQWTPLKRACLAKCRTPLTFLLTEWREGWRGAFAMGLRHGAFCLGCCWALMLLMFVGGVMSLAWMGGLAIYMLAEKLIPAGESFSRAAGVVLIAAGAALAAGSLAG
jgi:predicted metal-binding membrane protein